MRHLTHTLTTLAAVLLLSAACSRTPSNMVPEPNSDGFATGNLIFIADTTGMGSAICQSTGEYTHVAVVVVEEGKTYIYEAIPSAGVIRTPSDEWFPQLAPLLPDTNLSILSIACLRQLDCEYDTARLVQQLHESLGKPYDPYFQPSNDMLYCSELVCESFYDKSGKRLFHSRPMNFRTADGTYVPYWKHHFDSLGIPIPQEVLGSNPTDLCREPFISHLKIE